MDTALGSPVASRLHHTRGDEKPGTGWLDPPQPAAAPQRQPSGTYLPGVADRLVSDRLRQPRQRKVQADAALASAVGKLLDERWSPEQVAHELRERFPAEPRRWLCTESIYQAIYDPEVPVSRPAKRRRRWRRRVQGLERRGRLTAMTMIADPPVCHGCMRPVEVSDLVEVGHWEGGCIMGSGNRSSIGTLVERTTRYLILVHVPTGRPAAEAMRAGITTVLSQLPADLRRTSTWDQGKELAQNRQITAEAGTSVSFCDATRPWLRGSNEIMNGLLRDYFPKRTALRHATPERLRRRLDQRATVQDTRLVQTHRPARPPPDADVDRTTVDNRPVVPMTAHGHTLDSRSVRARLVSGPWPTWLAKVLERRATMPVLGVGGIFFRAGSRRAQCLVSRASRHRRRLCGRGHRAAGRMVVEGAGRTARLRAIQDGDRLLGGGQAVHAQPARHRPRQPARTIERQRD